MRAMIRRGVFPLLLVLLFAACNGGGEEAQPTPSPAVAQPSPMPEPTPTATPTPTPEPAVQRIAYIGTDLDVWIINADGSGQQKLFDIETEPGDSVSNLRANSFCCWSPDGSKFAVTKRGSEDITYIVSAGGETLLEVPAVRFAGWSHGGDMFVAWSPPALDVEAATRILDLEGNTVMELPESVAFSFSPDGRRLAFLQIQIVGAQNFPAARGIVADLQSAEVQFIDPDQDPRRAGALSPIFSPTDASLLAYGSRLFDLNTGQERSLPGRAVSWSPDGQKLLVGCDSPQVYDVQKGISVLEFDVRFHGLEAGCLGSMRGLTSWSPDSRLLATYDVFSDVPNTPSVIHIRDLATGDDRTIATLENLSPDVLLQLSPDGRHLLFSTSKVPVHGLVDIWVVGSDGANLTLLAEGTNPAWQPQP